MADVFRAERFWRTSTSRRPDAVTSVSVPVTMDDGTRVPLDVKPGDLILFGKYASQEITLDGEQLLIMRESEVLAVVQDAPKANEGS